MKAKRYEVSYAANLQDSEDWEATPQMNEDDIGGWVQAHEYQDLWELAEEMRACIDGKCEDPDCFGCIHCAVQAIMGPPEKYLDEG